MEDIFNALICKVPSTKIALYNADKSSGKCWKSVDGGDIIFENSFQIEGKYEIARKKFKFLYFTFIFQVNFFAQELIAKFAEKVNLYNSQIHSI